MQETEEDLRVVDRGLGICAMAQDLSENAAEQNIGCRNQVFHIN